MAVTKKVTLEIRDADGYGFDIDEVDPEEFTKDIVLKVTDNYSGNVTLLTADDLEKMIEFLRDFVG